MLTKSQSPFVFDDVEKVHALLSHFDGVQQSSYELIGIEEQWVFPDHQQCWKASTILSACWTDEGVDVLEETNVCRNIITLKYRQ